MRVQQMPAEAWFESVDQDRYEVQEQEHSVHFPEGSKPFCILLMKTCW